MVPILHEAEPLGSGAAGCAGPITPRSSQNTGIKVLGNTGIYQTPCEAW